MATLTKKRILLPLVNDATIALSNMCGNAAKLEYHDNDRASRDLKQAIVDFENGPLKALKDTVKDIRAEINVRPKKDVSNRKINTENLKQFQNK